MEQLRDISVLESNLLDEYYRCERALEAHQHALDTDSVQGYISRKLIKGREYHYLQWRDGDKVKSRYLKRDEVPYFKKEMELRKMHESSLRRIKRDMKKLRYILGDDVIDGYRDQYGAQISG